MHKRYAKTLDPADCTEVLPQLEERTKFPVVHTPVTATIPAGQQLYGLSDPVDLSFMEGFTPPAATQQHQPPNMKLTYADITKTFGGPPTSVSANHALQQKRPVAQVPSNNPTKPDGNMNLPTTDQPKVAPTTHQQNTPERTVNLASTDHLGAASLEYQQFADGNVPVSPPKKQQPIPSTTYSDQQTHERDYHRYNNHQQGRRYVEKPPGFTNIPYKHGRGPMISTGQQYWIRNAPMVVPRSDGAQKKMEHNNRMKPQFGRDLVFSKEQQPIWQPPVRKKVSTMENMPFVVESIGQLEQARQALLAQQMQQQQRPSSEKGLEQYTISAEEIKAITKKIIALKNERRQNQTLQPIVEDAGGQPEQRRQEQMSHQQATSSWPAATTIPNDMLRQDNTLPDIRDERMQQQPLPGNATDQQQQMPEKQQPPHAAAQQPISKEVLWYHSVTCPPTPVAPLCQQPTPHGWMQPEHLCQEMMPSSPDMRRLEFMQQQLTLEDIMRQQLMQQQQFRQQLLSQEVMRQQRMQHQFMPVQNFSPQPMPQQFMTCQIIPQQRMPLQPPMPQQYFPQPQQYIQPMPAQTTFRQVPIQLVAPEIASARMTRPQHSSLIVGENQRACSYPVLHSQMQHPGVQQASEHHATIKTDEYGQRDVIYPREPAPQHQQ